MIHGFLENIIKELLLKMQQSEWSNILFVIYNPPTVTLLPGKHLHDQSILAVKDASGCKNNSTPDAKYSSVIILCDV